MALDWSNERYVRLYRPSVDHRVLCWQARVIWPLLMQEADGAGVIGARRGVAAIAKALDVPLEVVEPGIADLLADGCLVEMPGGYCIRNYVAAQTATMSDSSRKARQREVDRAVDALASAASGKQASPQTGHATSREVTEGHDASRSVTPSRAEPNRNPETHTARAGSGPVDAHAAMALELHDRWTAAGRALSPRVGSTAKVGTSLPDSRHLALIRVVVARWASEAQAEDRELRDVVDERWSALVATREAIAERERTVKFWAAPVFWSLDNIDRDLAQTAEEVRARASPATGRRHPPRQQAANRGQVTTTGPHVLDGEIPI